MNTVAVDNPAVRILEKEYELVGDRSMDTHYYLVQTEVITRSSGGKLKNTDNYRQVLTVEPGGGSGDKADKFTCVRFTIKNDDSPEVTVPALEGYSYEVNKHLLDKNDLDDQGQLFGIPEATFEGLTDHNGEKLSFEVGYQVYSAFFYYHGFTGYAEPPAEGKGVQDLKKVGDKIVHDAAFVESPIPGKLAKEGSNWKNGEITLEFKGLTALDDRPCAILGFDSGHCPWVIPMNYMPVMNLKTTGNSNYHGDIYLDLESKWVRKLEMILSEITVTSMWGVPVDKSIPVSKLSIRAMSEAEFANQQI